MQSTTKAAAVVALGFASIAAGAATHTLPYVPPASSQALQGFIRVLNQSDRAGTVSIHAFDDTGREFGPVSLAIAARSARHFNSTDLERGNAGKGLSGGVGDGSGNWRLVLDTTLDVQPLAYIRTADGFVTSMHDVAAKDDTGRYLVPFFNPASNRSQVSRLRIINPSNGAARVAIDGLDDRGNGPASKVRLTIPAGGARMVTAQNLEGGASGLSGRFGDGAGKWQLSVTADRPILVLSLLRNPTGHLANLSTVTAEGATPPPTTGPDLVVQSPSVSNSSPNTGQSFTLRATVHNQGSGRSAATTLRYYRSSDATITISDTEVGTDAVGSLAESSSSSESIALKAPANPGTYYYGACVDSIPGEPEIANNCSAAVRVKVSSASGGFAPEDQDAFERWAVLQPGSGLYGKQVRIVEFTSGLLRGMAGPRITFSSGGRFTDISLLQGRYSYRNTGPNTGLLTMTGGGEFANSECTLSMTFASMSEGTVVFEGVRPICEIS